LIGERVVSDTPPTQQVDLPTSAQLLRATLMSMIAAALILVFIVLPSEYGIRPSELGQFFGIGGPGAVPAGQ